MEPNKLDLYKVDGCFFEAPAKDSLKDFILQNPFFAYKAQKELEHLEEFCNEILQDDSSTLQARIWEVKRLLKVSLIHKTSNKFWMRLRYGRNSFEYQEVVFEEFAKAVKKEMYFETAAKLLMRLYPDLSFNQIRERVFS